MSGFKLGQLYDPTFKKLSRKDVFDNIDAVAYSKEEKSYSVQLSEEQIQIREHEYTENGIQIAELESEKKRIAKSFNDQINELKESSAEKAKAVKFKSEQRHGTVFNVEDPETETMYVFDEEGVCVDHRPLTAGERQRVIKLENAQ